MVSPFSDLVRQPLGFITRRSVLPDTHKRALIKSLLELRGLGEHTTFRQLHESCTGTPMHDKLVPFATEKCAKGGYFNRRRC